MIPVQGTPTQVLGVELSADSFTALRLKPVIGRFYSVAEDQADGPRVVVLSEPYWRNALGGDPGVVDRTLSINGVSHTVVGVMPAEFELVAHASLAVPVEPGIKDFDRTNRKNQPSYEALARLRAGVSLEQAGAAMQGIHQRLIELYPESNRDWSMALKPLIDARVGGVRSTLWILLGAVVLVLFIACANVANLLTRAGPQFPAGSSR